MIDSDTRIPIGLLRDTLEMLSNAFADSPDDYDNADGEAVLVTVPARTVRWFIGALHDVRSNRQVLLSDNTLAWVDELLAGYIEQSVVKVGVGTYHEPTEDEAAVEPDWPILAVVRTDHDATFHEQYEKVYGKTCPECRVLETED